MESRIFLIIVVFFMLGSVILPAQIPSDELIHSIGFDGLKKTKLSYVQDFLSSEVGQALDSISIESDAQRLRNMPGIGQASYALDLLPDGVKVNFHVEEVKTLLPILKFGNITDNNWYQVGFVDINWKGKGHTLSAYYQNNDKRHSGQIYFKIPYFKSSLWGLAGSLTRRASREPLYFPDATVLYDYDNNSLALSGIRRLGTYRSLEFGGTFFREKYSKSEGQDREGTPGPLSVTQPKLLSKLELQTDRLNYNGFYLDGHSWRSTLQNVYNVDDKSWFHTLQFQGRTFRRIGNGINLAFRLRLAISTNNDSPFAPFVADSQVNLRGVGNRIDRGTAQVVLNVEYRQTIFDGNKWAGQVVAFADLGSWRNPGGELRDILNPDQFREFIGGGFRIIYKKIYGTTLRVDYGIDIFNKEQRGIVLGLGQYF